MNFEEFKRRYIEKLVRAGMSVPTEEDEDFKAFEDQLATIYVGITIYSEIQHEAAEKHRKEMAEQLKKRQSKIILPDGIKH